MARFTCRGLINVVELIEDEFDNGYTIRTDLMQDGDIIQCRDDSDMHVKKEGNSVILVKKCFKNHCFSKCD